MLLQVSRSMLFYHCPKCCSDSHSANCSSDSHSAKCCCKIHSPKCCPNYHYPKCCSNCHSATCCCKIHNCHSTICCSIVVCYSVKSLGTQKSLRSFPKNEFEFQKRIYWQSGKLKAFSISFEKKFGDLDFFCKITASVSEI